MFRAFSHFPRSLRYVLVGALATVTQANAGDFGFELTLSSLDPNVRKNMNYQGDPVFWKKLQAEYEGLCVKLGCQIRSFGNWNGFDVILPDGYPISLRADFKVVEITMPKGNRASYEPLAEFFTTHIFRRMKEMNGFAPMPSLGGGHVSMDVLSNFGWDPHALLDFIEDSILHQQMYRYMSRLPNDSIGPFDANYAEIRQILMEARKIDPTDEPRRLLRAYQSHFERLQKNAFVKHHAIGFHFVSDDPSLWRIEFRTPRPPRSLREALLFAEFLEMRRDHLRRNPPTRGLPEARPKFGYEPTSATVEAFQAFVRESGGSPLHFAPLLRDDVADEIRGIYCPNTLKPSVLHSR
jgi:hypothetical protein